MRYKYLKYDIQRGVKHVKTKTAIAITSLGLILGGGAGLSLAIFGTAHAALGGPICSVPTDYATIQAAVNDAGCSTINVAANTYTEHVAINRAVILNGANAGIAGNGARGAESIVDGTDNGTPFAITANNVTINGFTVKNGSNGGLNSGIWSQTGTQNSNILNNVITANDFGIWAQCGGNCLIQANLFDGNNKPGPGSDSISADSTTGLTINNNEFKNDSASNPILLQATAAAKHNNIVVTNNNFHNNTNASVIYAISITGGMFTGNTILPASDVTGISFSGADANITVTKNIITGGARGVRIENGGFGFGDNSNIVVNRNSVASDSEYGVGNISGYTGNVDATCNWWGAANGPGPVGPGSGSPVTTNVTFTPWLTSSNLNGSCGVPTNKDQCKNDGWKNLTDDNGKPFKNQGDCVSFVNGSHNHHKNVNNVHITNINHQTAKTGNANSNGNTNGGDAISGDASNSNNTVNNVNINN